MLSALKLLQQNGYLTLTDTQENPARLMFCISRDDLYKLRVERDDVDHIIRTILRLYNGVFTEFRAVDPQEIATWSGYTPRRVLELLQRLWRLRVIRYIPSNRSPILFLNEQRLPREDLYIAPETYRRRQELMHERFEHMLAYAANETQCRSAVLESHFGGAAEEEAPAPCGVCDICLARRREQKLRQTAGGSETLREELLHRLRTAPADPHTLAAESSCSPERVADTLRQLLDEGKIAASKEGELKIIP